MLLAGLKEQEKNKNIQLSRARAAHGARFDKHATATRAVAVQGAACRAV
jgi:hypothetical protein